MSDYLTVMSVHFTTVFLTTGLMSTLGAKEDLVYHIDIVKHILLEPVGRSFKALSVYSFLTLFWAVIALLLRSAYLVVFAAATGIIMVSWLFFKMIRIYFGREEEKDSQKEKLKRVKSSDELQATFLQLHLVIQNNMAEKQMLPLVENVALLIELYQYFLKEEGSLDALGHSTGANWNYMELLDDEACDAQNKKIQKRKYVQEFLTTIFKEIKESPNVFMPELYVRVYNYFLAEESVKKNHLSGMCMTYVAQLLVDYIFAEKENLSYTKDIVNDILRRQIKEYQKKVERIEDKDYYNQDFLQDGSDYLLLAEELFKTKIAWGSPISPYQPEGDGYQRFFCDEIRALVEKDEYRIKSGKSKCLKKDFFCSLKIGPVIEFLLDEDADETEWEENSFLQYMDEGDFVSCLPSMAIKYSGNDASDVLKDFYEGFRDRYCNVDDRKIWNYYKGLGIYRDEWLEEMLCTLRFEHFFPREEEAYIYVTMMCLFFRGCINALESEEGEKIAETVANLIFDYWKMAQLYIEDGKLESFYENTWQYIVSGARIGENVEVVNAFVDKLRELCKEDERPIPDRVRSFNENVVFGDYLSN